MLEYAVNARATKNKKKIIQYHDEVLYMMGVIPGGLWPPNFWPTTFFSGFSHTTESTIRSGVNGFFYVSHGNVR